MQMLAAPDLDVAKRPRAARRTPARYRTGLLRVSERELVGFAFDVERPSARLVVELLLDGFPAGLARADHFDFDILEQRLGDRCHGFTLNLPAGWAECATAAARIANTDIAVGDAIDLSLRPNAAAKLCAGEATWAGGLRICGWTGPGDVATAPTVSAFLDGECVATVAAEAWTHRGGAAHFVAVRGFELFLPERLADGRVRRIRIIDGEGRELSGSPVTVVAFEDGLARLLERFGDIDSSRLRGRLFDQLIPQAIPFSEFESWRLRFPLPASSLAVRPRVAVVLIGDEGLEATLASLENQRQCDWIACALNDDGGGALSPRALADFLDCEAEDVEFVAFLPAGAELEPGALARLAEALIARPESAIAYPDIVVRAADGSQWPLALTAYDRLRMIEQGYAAHAFAMRAMEVHKALENGVDDVFRLFLHGAETAREAGPKGFPTHVPGIFATFALPDSRAVANRLAQAASGSLGPSAEVEIVSGGLFPALRVRRAAPPLSLSVILVLRSLKDVASQLAHLPLCDEGEFCEAIVVASDLQENARIGSFVRSLPLGSSESFFAAINRAAATSRADLLLFLDESAIVGEAAWLAALLSRIEEPECAAVGPMIVHADGIIQAAGYVLGANFAVAPAYEGRSDGERGYGDALLVAREASAIPAFGMLTRRRHFEALGGFDVARFPRAFADVDYCLRLRGQNARVVVASEARLMRESRRPLLPRPSPDRPNEANEELRRLRLIWGEALLSDPFYSPLLSLDQTPFSALAWPPRDCSHRLPLGPVRRDAPLGF